jgi:hypothetical protein
VAYAPYRKAALLIPFNDVPHLFVVMNNPDKDGLCLLVMISSTKQGRSHDKACLLKAGDHEFIKHDSHIVYRLAYHSPSVHVSNMVQRKLYSEKTDVSDELFSRISEGLRTSDETTPAILRYAKEVGI